MYKVYFEDGGFYEGGNIKDSKWNDMPNKRIVRLDYTLAKKTVVLKGFEGYNHIVEKVRFVNKAGGSITKLILMGSTGGMVMRIIYDFQKQEVRQDSKLTGTEYNGKPTSGWKLGVRGQDISVEVI